jgi:hypothetical protein
MAERSGIAAQLGIATEETYGTYKAPTTFLPFDNESLVLTPEYIRNASLRAGQLVQAQNLHIQTTKSAGGDISLPFLDKSMGKLLNLLTGSTVTPTEISESEGYKAIFKVGEVSPYNKSATIQVGRPDVGGTVRAFSYVGCKATNLVLTVDAGGIGQLSVTVDAQDEKTGESLGEATYTSGAKPFPFNDWVVKLAGSESTNVRSFTLTVPIPQNTGRYNLGNSGLKDQPIANDLFGITIGASLEFASLADHERFTEETVVKFEAIATGEEIDAKADSKATVLAPAAKQVSSGPTVQGPDIIMQDVSFEVVANGTEAPLTIETISTDSSL